MAEEKQGQEVKVGFLRRITLTETFALATLPAAAYLIIFVYNWGYFDVFKIPLRFIQFNIREVFVVCGALLAFAVFLFSLFDFLSGLFLSEIVPVSIAARVAGLTPMVMLFAAYLLLFADRWIEWIMFLAGVLILACILFVLPVMKQRGKGSYLEKLEAADREAADRELQRSKAGGVTTFTTRFVGKNAFLVGWYVYIALQILYSAGRSSAVHQREFHVASVPPESVALVISEDYIVCAPFDRNTKEIEPGFMILDRQEISSVRFRLEQIGPLHLKKIPSAATITPTSTVTPTSMPSVVPTPTP
jgi:hypothetical protein